MRKTRIVVFTAAPTFAQWTKAKVLRKGASLLVNDESHSHSISFPGTTMKRMRLPSLTY